MTCTKQWLSKRHLIALKGTRVINSATATAQRCPGAGPRSTMDHTLFCQITTKQRMDVTMIGRRLSEMWHGDRDFTNSRFKLNLTCWPAQTPGKSSWEWHSSQSIYLLILGHRPKSGGWCAWVDRRSIKIREKNIRVGLVEVIWSVS